MHKSNESVTQLGGYIRQVENDVKVVATCDLEPDAMRAGAPQSFRKEPALTL